MKKKLTYKEKLIALITEKFAFEEWAIALETEYFFMHSRQWRFDYALPSLRIAIEYQGGIFMKTKSGHTNVRGQTRDWEKMNEAQIRGWLILSCNPKTIDDGSFLGQLDRAIKVRKGDIRYE